MNKLRRKVIHVYRKISRLTVFTMITDSLEALIPIFMVSAVIQVLINFPVPAYYTFIREGMGGHIIGLLNVLLNATYGMLSVYVTVAVSDKVNDRFGKPTHRLAVAITSVASFFILSGIFNSSTFNLDILGPKNLLTAIICGAFSARLYLLLMTRLVFNDKHYVDGISTDFSTVVISILPALFVFVVCGVVNACIYMTGYSTTYDLMTGLLSRLFTGQKNSLFAVIRFELLQNLLWMVGIHGSDVLGETKYQLFDLVLDAVKLGNEGGLNPIINGVFIDVFVLLGGCGATWSLVIALAFFSRQKNERFLARVSAIPMVFNINELLLLGLPVIYNPVYLVPFLLTPIVNILVCYLAMSTGFVPLAINTVNWTTPVFLGGYLATGSVKGSILQLVCVILGVVVYAPFVMIDSRLKAINSHEHVKMLEDILKEAEESREPIEFLTLPGLAGRIARTLSVELGDYIDSDDFTLYYQPQFNDSRKLIGAEALLRWRHEKYGPIYPPLAVTLAEEIGRLTELEEKIFLTVFKSLDELLKYKEDESFHISINVTGITIQTDEFEEFLNHLHIIYPGKCKHVLIEITEQATLKVDESFIARLQRIKSLGFTFGIDDFSMGNTSIKYLQSNIFDIVKLDGGISRDIFNERSREIIASISRLTEGLNIETIAEYVETEEQRKALEDVGCYIYQGYLYSPAIPLSKFTELGEQAKSDEAGDDTTDSDKTGPDKNRTGKKAAGKPKEEKENG